jgi:phosphatidate cytidylyltransferase
MLRKRVLTALWSVPLIILAVWFDEPVSWFTVLVAVWGVLAVLEFYRLTGVSKTPPLAVFGTIWTLLFIVGPQLGFILGMHFTSPIPILLTSAVVLSLVLLVFIRQQDGAFGAWAWTIAGIFYVGWLLGYLVALRLETGSAWVYLAILATFGSDTAAYFVGKAIGKRPLAPHISPGKTWEGAVAGLFGGVIISLLFTLPTPLRLPVGYAEAVALGVLISVFGQLGDLAESILKRSTGAKESGGLMPGHGGLLDRMDSVVFAGVAVYYYYYLFVI